MAFTQRTRKWCSATRTKTTIKLLFIISAQSVTTIAIFHFEMAAIKATLAASIIAIRTTFDASIMQSRFAIIVQTNKHSSCSCWGSRSMAPTHHSPPFNTVQYRWRNFNSTSVSSWSETITAHWRLRLHQCPRPQNIQPHRSKCSKGFTKS